MKKTNNKSTYVLSLIPIAMMFIIIGLLFFDHYPVIEYAFLLIGLIICMYVAYIVMKKKKKNDS